MVLLLLLIFHSAQGQVQKIKPAGEITNVQHTAGVKSAGMSTAFFKEIRHQQSGNKWAVSVKPTFSRQHYSDEIRQLKESKLQQKISSYRPSDESHSTRAVNPAIGTNFEANWSIDGTPPDNTLAISNSGYIVTANNDGIEYYSASGAYLYFDYWSDFFDDPALPASIYDPRVIYDSGADRFVMVVLHGTNANNSKVLVCFSKTNNPQNGWWVYTLTGNPLNNNCWFDYPALAVSNNEIYITGNLFNGNSFNQAVIYQITKTAGFNGESLDWIFWSGLNTTPFEAFSLVPASYGHQGNYGPGVYLVSNENSGENRIRLWDLTDDMSGNPQLDSYTINTDEYSPAANALQLGSTDQLDNGDCRIQNAFYLDGTVHFVFHSDIGGGWNGIIYNRIEVSNTTIESSNFGLQGSYDYAYPAVVSFSTNANDPSVMIAFLRSSEETYPQVRVVNCDQDFTWSSSALVKNGETFVDFSNGNERWGDYTGIARKHNSSSGRIWLAGCYGADISSQNVFNTYKTWVAEIYAGSIVGVNEPPPLKAISVYPNPVYDLMTILFTAEKSETTTISILDMQGKLIKVLYRDTPRPGENKLTFNKGPLPAGPYVISISTPTQILKNETIIIPD